MYCTNCGNPMDSMASVCVKCGFGKGVGRNYCANCAAQIVPEAAACLHCGMGVVNTTEQKSKMTAGILGILVGGWGVHNFYLGYTGKGIAQIFLSFCFGIGYIWGLIEGIMILTGSINTDANGVPLKD